jgi:actin-related protein
LESRLLVALPALERDVETVVVVVDPKGVDSRMLSWKGMAVCAKCDTMTQGMWTTRKEWNKPNTSAFLSKLREKLPYYLDPE